MLRRSPCIKIGPGSTGQRYSNFQSSVGPRSGRSNQHRDLNFHASAPADRRYLIYSEEQEREYFDDENFQNSENIPSRREGFCSSSEVEREKNISNIDHSSNQQQCVRSCVNSVPQIRVLNASHVQSEYTQNIPDTDVGSYGISIVPTSSSTYEDGEEYIRTYKRRFWILFVFCTLNLFSCIQWNTWGPISESVSVAFPDWDSFTVAMMDNWVCLVFVICVLPVCWVTRKIGLRLGILISSFILAIGLCLRCFWKQSPPFTIMCHLCSILIGISMTLILSSPPMIASVWFPPNEPVIFAVGQLGTVGSYLEPLMIRDPSSGASSEDIKSDIMVYLYIAAGIGGLLFLVILAYFPSAPPLPPSYTSTTERLKFKEGLLSIVRNWNFIIFVSIYGVAVGPSLGWIGVLNFSLKPLGFNQDEAMFVGLLASFACCFLTVVTGRLADMMYRQVFVSVSLGLSLNYATIPLFYELSVEILYPAHEVLVGGVVTAFDSLTTSAFLLIYLFRTIGFGWVNYALVASNAIPAFLLLFVTLPYGRAKLDIQDSDQSV
ncbi:Disrupted in renal carcinoma protein 2-like protein [Armadillidium nasatum]|uniref:Disrupted in renal carcinoma protein 2-like protein n=1 Tax=Armadillidium nasatum TaxID=96803 RepID=A0A5N5SL38_9CRUS|nr:Disrupted in renal carcinoma protein 2-like protein [Armadillidium nasatum]